ncbi:MAG: amidohydrolase family protein [Nitrososphaerota archaeon]|nr:amidohydrolase family protein [Nitrososphaerota archaeon]MDG6956476.1 amidohydrolase family protein [Nitrososphaerota archaeon]MDG6957607.1 amidohydrolase family protein [Nitrososphaerota archaeon]MDG6959754.1 amidohydrolase family protein [Nitrososphaerota archaeon]MDG6965582.1 amidohydrolase family protein [Nitrososphaerota archaeon]
MNRAIDCHIHLSRRPDDLLRRYAELNGLKYSLDELLGEMRESGVERGLLLSPPMESGGILPNEEVLALCRESRGILSPVITVEPTRREAKAALGLAEENRSEVKGFKVRLGYVDAAAESPVFEGIYDYAEAQGLPVMFHTGDTATSDGDLARSHPLTLDALANRREELKIVICHFGNPWMEDTAELIYKHPKVYADISGLTTGGGAYSGKLAALLARKLSEAVYFAGGGEKVLFGTDYPVTRHRHAFELVSLMDADESDKERILWRNSKEVFGL